MNVIKSRSLISFLVLFAVAFLVTPFFASCTDDDDEYTYGVWYRRSDFDGLARSAASSFTIGNKGYVCCGYSSSTKRLNDLWEYNVDGDYWVQLASMPEDAGTRSGAVGFVVGSKGYVATGFNGDYLNDAWEYDPASNTWQRMDDIENGAREAALAFGIGNYGYIGTGYNGNYLKDFYRLNPTAAAGSQWEVVYGFGGQKRRYATTFVIDDIAYVVCGENNGSMVSDFWKFDPAADTWTQLRDIYNSSDDDYDDDYNAIPRKMAVGFVIDGCGYLVTGDNKSDYWKYDPATDLWDGEDFTAFEGTSRSEAVSISTGTRGFVTTGRNGSSYRFDDNWELSPYELDED